MRHGSVRHLCEDFVNQIVNQIFEISIKNASVIEGVADVCFLFYSTVVNLSTTGTHVLHPRSPSRHGLGKDALMMRDTSVKRGLLKF